MPLTPLRNTSLKLLLNHFMTGMGEVDAVHVDAEARRITASIRLNGEDAALEVSALRYRIENDGLVIEVFACERPWLQTILNRFLAGRVIPVPAGIGMMALNALL